MIPFLKITIQSARRIYERRFRQSFFRKYQILPGTVYMWTSFSALVLLCGCYSAKNVPPKLQSRSIIQRDDIDPCGTNDCGTNTIPPYNPTVLDIGTNLALFTISTERIGINQVEHMAITNGYSGKNHQIQFCATVEGTFSTVWVVAVTNSSYQPFDLSFSSTPATNRFYRARVSLP